MRLNLSLSYAVALLACMVLASCSLGQTESVNFPLTVRKEMDLDVRGEAVALAWSADGSKLAAASDWGGTLTVWDRAGHQLSQVKSHADGPALDGSLEFTSDASQLLFNISDRNQKNVALNVIDARTGSTSRLVDGPNAERFRMSPDKNTVALIPRQDSDGTEQQDIQFYDTANWNIQHSIHVSELINYLNYFDGGSRIVVGTFLGVPHKAVAYVIETDLASAPTRLDISDAPASDVTAVSGSPDGQFIFVGLGGGGPGPHQSHGKPSDSVARILRVSDGAQVATLSPSWGPIRAAAWDPQNRYVVFLDAAGDLYFWRPFAAALSYSRFHLDRSVTTMAMSPDGNRIAADAGGAVRVFSIE